MANLLAIKPNSSLLFAFSSILFNFFSRDLAHKYSNDVSHFILYFGSQKNSYTSNKLLLNCRLTMTEQPAFSGTQQKSADDSLVTFKVATLLKQLMASVERLISKAKANPPANMPDSQRMRTRTTIAKRPHLNQISCGPS